MGDEHTATWRFAGAELDGRTREVRVHGQTVSIEPKPLEVLRVLLEHAGEVVTSEEMLEAVWEGRPVHEAAVSNAIGKLRRALNDDNQSLIVTVPKVGYRLAAKVERTLDREAPVQLGLKAGDGIPGRPHWKLTEQLGGGNAWVAEHEKTGERRFYKFCVESRQLRALKREVTLYRLLNETLGNSAPTVKILDWQFEQAPYYLESEYVGVDLRSWFDQKGGPAAIALEQRLDLLAQTAEAMAVAHSVGVLHKDLKPQNILVEEKDGQPHIRLCDFGAGQMLDPARLGGLDITVLGFTHTLARTDSSGAGTIVYMAPELLSGGSPSVQSDVYALGVLTYQVVTGHWRPIASGWEAEVEDLLLRDDIRQATQGSPQKRLPSAQLLAERLRSLPARREQQARQQAEQARLHQVQHELERAQARKPWIIAAGVLLVAGLGISSLLLFRERRAEHLASIQHAIAMQFNEFLSHDIIRAASPDYGGRYDITLKEAIKSSLPELPRRLANTPLVEAALDLVLADTLNALSEPREAVRLAERSAKLYADNMGPDDPRTLDAQIDAFSYRTPIDASASIRPAFEETYARLKRRARPGDLAMLKARMIEAELAYHDNNFDLAAQLFDDLLRDYPSPASAEDMKVIDRVRVSYVKADELRPGCGKDADLAKQWLPHFVSTYGAVGRLTLRLHEELGLTFVHCSLQRPEQPHFAEAEAELRTAVSGNTALYGRDSVEALISEELLGEVYVHSERCSEAIPILVRVHDGLEKKFGVSSWRTFRPVARELYCLYQVGPEAEATAFARNLLGQGRRYLARTDYLYRHILSLSAATLLKAGQTEEASPLVDELAQIVDQLHLMNVDRDTTSKLLYIQGVRAQQRGDIPAAIGYLTEAVKELEKIDGPDTPPTRDARTRLQQLQGQVKTGS